MNKLMRWIIRPAVCWAAPLPEVGSTAASFSTPAKAQRELRFAFVSTCVGYSFFDTIKKGMDDAAAALGVKCDYMGTPGVDAKAQAEMVRQVFESACAFVAAVPVFQLSFFPDQRVWDLIG